MHTRPVWVEVSRHKLIANYLELCAIAQKHLVSSGVEAPQDGPTVLGVIKANAYGHGMSDCAQLLHSAGARWLGVTSVEEAIRARNVCPTADILVMSGIWDGEAGAVVENGLTPIVWESFHLDLLEAEARRQGMPPRSIGVHLELDTGMSRQGVHLHGVALKEILMRFHAGSALRLDGVATHFSSPEVLDSQETDVQRSRFDRTLHAVATAGLRPIWIHAGNSATILRGEQLAPLLHAANRVGAQLMLRPGLSLYGYAPRLSKAGEVVSPTDLLAPKLSPVLAWKTLVTSLRSIDTGQAAGYNSTFRAYRPTRLALLPLGYADGLSRLLSNRGSVLIRGKHAPIAGRVSMDQTIVDVTDIAEVEIGDEVVIIGCQSKAAQQADASISAWEIADLENTIPYEVLCDISARVPRVLVD